MPLSGLLAATIEDRAISSALAADGAAGLSISGPAALQPFAIAALAARADGSCWR